ncbi:MAG: CPBP family intramembrane glutamic endopeptidase [Alphaproteobacteria bacterium]
MVKEEHSSRGPTALSRTISGLEFLLAAALVIAHNVFKTVPNEVFLLAGLGLLSLILRNRNILAFGLGRPRSWALVIFVAVAAAAARILLGEFVIDPWTAQHFPPQKLSEVTEGIRGNLPAALKLLGLVWIFAALGEEFGYRGYILNRGAEALGGSLAAYVLALLAAAVLFGIGHWYKGPAGIIDLGRRRPHSRCGLPRDGAVSGRPFSPMASSTRPASPSSISAGSPERAARKPVLHHSKGWSKQMGKASRFASPGATSS